MTVQIPKPVELAPADAAKLSALRSKANSIENEAAGSQRRTQEALANLQTKTIETWREIAEKYSLDIVHVNYALSPDDKFATPVSMRFEVSE